MWVYCCPGGSTSRGHVSKRHSRACQNARIGGHFAIHGCCFVALRHLALRYDFVSIEASRGGAFRTHIDMPWCFDPACRAWGQRYTANGDDVALRTSTFYVPARSSTTAYVTLRDAAVSSLMRGGFPLSSTTIIVNACRQRRHAVGRAQPSSLQITFQGT